MDNSSSCPGAARLLITQTPKLPYIKNQGFCHFLTGYVYAPGARREFRGIFRCNNLNLNRNRIRKDGNAGFFDRDDHPFEAPAAGDALLVRAAAAVVAAEMQTPKLLKYY